MKMYAFYSVNELPMLEYNHKKYCEFNKIEYNKVLVSSSLAEKYSYILAFLQKNKGEVLFFIDNFSYFKNFDFIPELKNDVFIQKNEERLVDNFFMVKSTEKTIKIFEEILNFINKKGFFQRNWKDISFQISIKDDFCVEYPAISTNGKYINVCLYEHSNSLDIQNVLVVNFSHKFQEREGIYFAETTCSPFLIKYTVPAENYECFNPGHQTAFVTMYTPNIKEAGIISEINIKEYCLRHNITYYIYRDVTEDLKNKNISGAWCKPWLLLNHFELHKNLAWIDSDILLGKDFKIETFPEIVVYKDPYHIFNSGYMMFKTNKKNKELLEFVIENFMKIEGPLDGVYTNGGGDQPRFIEAVAKYYPEYSPISGMLGNMHPVYPISISPYKSDVMIHFMGFDKKMREHIMKGYNELLLKQYST